MLCTRSTLLNIYIFVHVFCFVAVFLFFVQFNSLILLYYRRFVKIHFSLRQNCNMLQYWLWAIFDYIFTLSDEILCSAWERSSHTNDSNQFFNSKDEAFFFITFFAFFFFSSFCISTFHNTHISWQAECRKSITDIDGYFARFNTKRYSLWMLYGIDHISMWNDHLHTHRHTDTPDEKGSRYVIDADVICINLCTSPKSAASLLFLYRLYLETLSRDLIIRKNNL